jgi:hypothetical protein
MMDFQPRQLVLILALIYLLLAAALAAVLVLLAQQLPEVAEEELAGTYIIQITPLYLVQLTQLQ